MNFPSDSKPELTKLHMVKLITNETGITDELKIRMIKEVLK